MVSRSIEKIKVSDLLIISDCSKINRDRNRGSWWLYKLQRWFCIFVEEERADEKWRKLGLFSNNYELLQTRHFTFHAIFRWLTKNFRDCFSHSRERTQIIYENPKRGTSTWRNLIWSRKAEAKLQRWEITEHRENAQEMKNIGRTTSESVDEGRGEGGGEREKETGSIGNRWGAEKGISNVESVKSQRQRARTKRKTKGTRIKELRGNNEQSTGIREGEERERGEGEDQTTLEIQEDEDERDGKRKSPRKKPRRVKNGWEQEKQRR